MTLSPIELGIIATVAVVVLAPRLLVKWGGALGETWGYIQEKASNTV